MEGRWAQLAVDAHIAHAIDYSRPVKPFIENIIFNALERKRTIELLSTMPCATGDGDLSYPTISMQENLQNDLFSWERTGPRNMPNKAPQESINEKINFLNTLRK